MVGELLKKETMTVVVVDWGQGSSMSNPYENAAANARLIGVQVALLIDMLSQDFNVSLEKYHIIGHSLGAHVGGFVAEKQRKRRSHWTNHRYDICHIRSIVNHAWARASPSQPTGVYVPRSRFPRYQVDTFS